MTLQLVAEKGSGAVYKILGADGQEYGPVNAETLQRWVTEGRVNAQTLVQAEGTAEWKRLSALPELQAFLSAAGSTSRLGPEGAAALSRPEAQRPQKGLAILGLVLGCLSVTLGSMWVVNLGLLLIRVPFAVAFVGELASLCVVTGLLAVLAGRGAHACLRRAPALYGTKALPQIGIALGWCSLGGMVLAAAVLPAGPSFRERRAAGRCYSNLHHLGFAARTYAGEHGEVLPPDLFSLSNLLASPEVLVCPRDNTRPKTTNWAQVLETGVTYQFLTPGARLAEVSNQAVFRCPVHRSAWYGDGSVLYEQAGQPQTPPRRRSTR